MRIDEHKFFARKLDYDYRMCVKGEGVWVFDADGNKYLDACSGANVSSIGHGVKEIGAAMQAQADAIAYVPPQHFLNQPTIDLCRRLLEHAPDHFTRVMLCSGGSEANENALKIARQYHVYKGNSSKYLNIARWQGFHGNTIVADAVGGTTSRRKISAPMLPEVPHIKPSNCFHCPYHQEYPNCGMLCAKALEDEILQLGPENVSAFICEPVVGSANAACTPVKEYFPMIREICDKHDVLWIDDEIMAGLAYVLSGGKPVSGFSDAFSVIGQGYLWKIPIPVVIMAIMMFFGWFLLNKTTLGKYIYGIGGNEEACRLAGVNISKMRYFIYGFSGFAAALAAIVLLSRVNSGQPKAGTGFEFEVITAVVLGGVSIKGGAGNIWGVLTGVLIMGIMKNGFVLMNVNEYFQMVLQGFLLLFAVGFDMLINKPPKLTKEKVLEGAKDKVAA